MKTNEKYTKVLIESEDDNPKNTGRYLTEFGWLTYNGKWIYPKNKGTTYLRSISWYLLPEQADKEKCYPEEFVNWLAYDSQKYIDLISYWDAELQTNKRVFCKHGSRSVIHDRMTIEQVYDFWLNEIKDK